MQLGIWLHDSKDPELTVSRQVIEYLTGRQVDCFARADQHCAGLAGVRALKPDAFFARLDALIVLGGDGSMLAAAREGARFGVPMLGVNLGHRGFMTECEPGQLRPALEALVEGRFRVENRMMLRAILMGLDSRALWQVDALNDVVLCNRAPVQLIHASASIETCLLERYACDAMIVSSPTGSTAYSMAAGGPIINPQMPCMVLTPVCASSLTARPMVLAEDDRLTLTLTDSSQEGLAVADGQNRFPMNPGQRLLIEKSPYTTGLIRIFPHNFYQVLRDKRDEWARDQYLKRG